MTRKVIIMAAPNGARKTRSDHSSLPLSIEDTAREAAACYAAGACALHAHVRGVNDEHVLDAGLYRELIAEVSTRAPGMLVQITSEAVGVYSPEQQVDCVQAVKPEMASMGLREISTNFERPEFAEDLENFLDYRDRGIIPAAHRCVLFVLGRYKVDFQSEPDDLAPFLRHALDDLDWFTCAFGHREQDCVMAAIEAGGNARVGFENNLFLPDGEIAPSSAALVESLVERMRQQKLAAAGSEQARQLLGIRSA
jgi:uncharacterized protein (DUF849 family)